MYLLFVACNSFPYYHYPSSQSTILAAFLPDCLDLRRFFYVLYLRCAALRFYIASEVEFEINMGLGPSLMAPAVPANKR